MMPKVPRVAILIAASSLAASMPACTESSPTPPTPSSPRVLTLLTITPLVNSLFIGESRTLSAFAAYSDGNGAVVTASWQTDAPGVARVGGDGVLTAVGPGRAAITATVEGKSASVQVSVFPNFAGNWTANSTVIIDCRSAHPTGCTLPFPNTVTIRLVLDQVAERVTGELGTNIGRATVQGTVGLDGVLSLQGETEATDGDLTYLSFRIESWRAIAVNNRLTGRAVLQQAEFPEYRSYPRHPTKQATCEFREIPRS